MNKMFAFVTLQLSFCSYFNRAEPNSKNLLPKGIPFPETEFSESKLCKVASPELQETLPNLWRQVLDSF